MKKMLNTEKNGHGLVAIANRCAFGLMMNSVNSTCQWVHHQPKVPEEAKKYRKF